MAGENLSSNTEALVVGESIAGGTTTALGVLMALGYDAENKISSTMPQNPHELKIRTVREGLGKTKFKPEEMRRRPDGGGRGGRGPDDTGSSRGHRRGITEGPVLMAGIPRWRPFLRW